MKKMNEWTNTTKKVKHVDYQVIDDSKTKKKNDGSPSPIDAIRQTALYTRVQPAIPDDERPSTAGFNYGDTNDHLPTFPKTTILDTKLQKKQHDDTRLYLPSRTRSSTSPTKVKKKETNVTSFYSPKKSLTLKPFHSKPFRRPLGWDAFVSSKHDVN
mmetsp:Transcript_12156/g.18102  ORF Transcript_12156/g.18102 Transcript_12156/m.18102 type:complete len:157 (+) Transcript_12156:1547-2017(+)